MKCSYLILSQYIDGELENVRSGEVDAHLVACDRCKNAMENMQYEIDRLRELVTVYPTESDIDHLLEVVGVSGTDNHHQHASTATIDSAINSSLPWMQEDAPMERSSKEHSRTSDITEPGETEDPQDTLPNSVQSDNSPSLQADSSPPLEAAEDFSPAPQFNPVEQVELTGNSIAREDTLQSPKVETQYAGSDKQSLDMHAGTSLPQSVNMVSGVIENSSSLGQSTRPEMGSWIDIETNEPTGSCNSDDGSFVAGIAEKKTLLTPNRNSLALEQESISEENIDNLDDFVLKPASFLDNLQYKLEQFLPAKKNVRRAPQQGIEVLSGTGAPKERAYDHLLSQAKKHIGQIVERMTTQETLEESSVAGEYLQDDLHVPGSFYVDASDDYPFTSNEVPESHTGLPLVQETNHPSVGRHLQHAHSNRVKDVYEKREPATVTLSSRILAIPDTIESHRATLSRERMLQIGGIIIIVTLFVTIIGLTRADSKSPALATISAVKTSHSSIPAVHKNPTPSNKTSTETTRVPLQNVLPTLGNGGKGIVVQDLRYGQHLGYYRVVFDLSGTVEPTTTIGMTTDGTTEMVVLDSTTPGGPPNLLSETSTVSGITVIPPSHSINESVYEFKLARPVTVQASYEPNPSRLIVDFYPTA